ncbi:hypothetical protein [Ornithinibacillus contaminans]|uniref:hypothetical protein n=1 Tax=Ornithinibacillus contaminans TaxID=694055 RepID=UPI00191BF541|nr:hypothetical protein [Ornithinibacillus contaminans]
MDISEIIIFMLVYGGLFLYTLQTMASNNKILVRVKSALLIMLYVFIATIIWSTYKGEEYHSNAHGGYVSTSYTGETILMIVGLSVYSLILIGYSIFLKRKRRTIDSQNTSNSDRLLMRRFLTVLLAIIVLAAFLSWILYVPHSQRYPNGYYFGFFETIIIVIIYATPIYIAGLPISIGIDRLLAKINNSSRLLRYVLGLSLYSLAGLLVSVILLILFDQNIYTLEIVPFALCCVVASNLYYHLFMLVSRIKRNKDFILNNDSR